MLSSTAQRFKRLARAAVRVALRLVRPEEIAYSRPRASWDEAKRGTVAYDADKPFASVLAAALAVKEGRAAFSVGGRTFPVLRYRWSLLAPLLDAFARAPADRPVHVLDFGGALGRVYFQHLNFLARQRPFLWSVVELPRYVEAGNTRFADGRLQFFDTLDAAAARAPVDVALFSGSLEYLDEPERVLSAVAALRPRAIMLDWTHLTGAEADEIRVQRIRPPRSEGRYALRVFSRRGFTERMRSLGYDLVAPLPDGFYFERRA